MISFRKLALHDMPLLHQWYNSFEVKKWYAKGKTLSVDDIKALYKPRIEGDEPVFVYIFEKNEQSIGLIQYYGLADFMPDDLTQVTLQKLNVNQNETVGLDLFIGEPSLIGKGVGAQVITSFIENMLPKGFKAVFVDPEKGNMRAIRAYEKCGFKCIEHVNSLKTEWMILTIG